jgi:hypothetical protein
MVQTEPILFSLLLRQPEVVVVQRAERGTPPGMVVLVVVVRATAERRGREYLVRALQAVMRMVDRPAAAAAAAALLP